MGRDTTHFVFIRHGETDWNRQQRFQGQIDVPLNDTGLAQAQRLGLRLAAEPADCAQGCANDSAEVLRRMAALTRESCHNAVAA